MKEGGWLAQYKIKDITTDDLHMEANNLPPNRIHIHGKALMFCGLYYKHITIVNDDSSIVNKFGASLTDAARVVIYDHHMFIVQVIVVSIINIL